MDLLVSANERSAALHLTPLYRIGKGFGATCADQGAEIGHGETISNLAAFGFSLTKNTYLRINLKK